MKEVPKMCLKCKEIVTFCECTTSITNKDEYIASLEIKLKEVGEQLRKEYMRGLRDGAEQIFNLINKHT